ncbi:cold shock domain protein 1 [Prunus dulcis]|uniref:Cold shock domain protein 1 n=1 Tax=Prunus dulcis TaxID=3755 RepID=A0A5H2XN12_PRUDU|nr:cold shock domain protein 1 [Prunus dulcis]
MQNVIFIPINGSYLEIGVSTARTQQAGPSRGQAAWDYLIMSARRARTRGRGQRWGPNPPPPSPSPPPSPPVPSPPPSPPAGDNALDMRHVLSQFTRTMATALRGRRGTESSEIKRVKNLGQKNLWAVQTQQKQNYGLLMWKEFLRRFEKLWWDIQAVVTANTYPNMRALAQAAERVSRKLGGNVGRRRRDTPGVGGPSQGPSKRGGSSSSSASGGWSGDGI